MYLNYFQINALLTEWHREVKMNLNTRIMKNGFDIIENI